MIARQKPLRIKIFYTKQKTVPRYHLLVPRQFKYLINVTVKHLYLKILNDKLVFSTKEGEGSRVTLQAYNTHRPIERRSYYFIIDKIIINAFDLLNATITPLEASKDLVIYGLERQKPRSVELAQ